MTARIIAVLGAISTALLAIRPILDLIAKWRAPPTQKILALDHKPRILVVDDDPRDLEQIRLTLNGDYEVHTYRRQFKALADIALECDRGGAFEIIILDYMMEPLTGKEMAAEIREWQRGMTKRSKIVLFTRMGNLIEKPAGVAAIWRKGADEVRIREKVRELLG